MKLTGSTGLSDRRIAGACRFGQILIYVVLNIA